MYFNSLRACTSLEGQEQDSYVLAHIIKSTLKYVLLSLGVLSIEMYTKYGSMDDHSGQPKEHPFKSNKFITKFGSKQV